MLYLTSNVKLLRFFGCDLVGISSRIVPEYSFLDARGLGAYEGRGLAAVNEVSISNLNWMCRCSISELKLMK